MQEHCTLFDMFQKVHNFNELINLIVVQNGREFQTNAKDMMAFLGINYIEYQLLTVQNYWECG